MKSVGSWAIAFGLMFMTQASQVMAQNPGYARQQSTTSSAGPSGATVTESGPAPPQEPADVEHPSRPRLGKKFWSLWAIAIGLSIANVENTAHCSSSPHCWETNPLFGRRPSRLRMYAIAGAGVGVSFYVSQMFKRDPGGDTALWWVPPVMVIGANSTSLAYDLSHPIPSGVRRPSVANLPPSEVVLISGQR